MYLDDMTVGGAVEDILHDLTIIKNLERINLTLNNSKSEITCEDATIRQMIITAAWE